MNNIINIVAVAFLLYAMIKDMKKGCLIYILLVYLCPVFIVGSSRLSFDIITFPLLFAVYLLNSKFKIIICNRLKELFLYLFVYCILTFLTGIVYKGDFSIITAYAIFRFIITVLIIMNVWAADIIKNFDKAMSIIMSVEFVCSITQMMNIVDVRIFYNLYYKESLAPLAGQLKMGYFNRAYGTTGSPIILGGMAALAFTFYLHAYLSHVQNVSFPLPKLIISVLCGLLALSKTAIISIPIATIVILVININKIGVRTFFKVIGFLGCIIIFVLGVSNWLSSQGFAVKYYLSFLSNPFSALNTRYGSGSGNLTYAINTIKDNPIIGVGNAKLNNSFVGDSVYIVLLYETGIVGFFVYFLSYIRAFIINIKKRNKLSIVLFIVFALISFGNALQVSYYIILYVAVIFYEASYGNKCETETRENYYEKNNMF